jgi:hypothetical protein
MRLPMVFILVTLALVYRLGLMSLGKNLTTWQMDVSSKTKASINNKVDLPHPLHSLCIFLHTFIL